MDEQTMKDYIEDLFQERASLYDKIGFLTSMAEVNKAEANAWRQMAMEQQAEVRRLENELARHA